MTAETIAAVVSELMERYAGAKSTQDGSKTLVKLPMVQFPAGCQPESSDALVQLDPAAPKPELFLRGLPRLPSGTQPSGNSVLVAGESWFTYSFNLRWEEERHTAVQFVEGKLRRFAQNA